MSTVDSYAFLAAVTLGRDLVGRARGVGAEVGLAYARRALVATAALAIVLALAAQSVVTLWKTLGSVGTPVLLVPLAAAHSSLKLDGRAVVRVMVVSGCVSLAWLALGRGGPWLGVEAVFPGMLVSLAALAFRA
jgi:SSS family solute:Na+ symporter